MARIICPNCGEVIEVDPSQVEDLTRQLRDELFAHDLEQRLAEAGHVHEARERTVREEERRAADRRVAEVQAKVAELSFQLSAATREGELAVERERVQAGEKRATLERQLGEAQSQAALREAALREQARKQSAALTEELTRVKAQLAAQEEALRAQAQAEVLKATSALEQSRSQLEAQLKVEQANSQQAQANLREEMARREGELAQRSQEQLEVLAQRSQEQLEAKQTQIEQYKAEVERLRDYRMRLSTKLVGESLERHCESEFNRIRMQAYPLASFEKDNEAVGGTKGDFIFRDYDEDGNELLSIMFEMKNEEEGSSVANRKRNEDHFKKLDADRTKKGCEYAVLVSTLEPDNDFYNAGIADVSWRYPKMFVVRPQCFTTIVGLLKAAALAAHPYKLQLERARREELDVTRFEEKVTGIVEGIANDYSLAAKNYEQAEKDIDAIIAKLQHLKGQLGTAAKHFGTASKRGEKLSVKRLTWGNQTMKAAFAQAAATDQQEQSDAALEPDELE